MGEEFVEATTGFIGEGDDRRQIVAVLATQLAEALPTGPHRSQAFRIVLDGLADVTHLVGCILELESQ